MHTCRVVGRLLFLGSFMSKTAGFALVQLSGGTATACRSTTTAAALRVRASVQPTVYTDSPRFLGTALPQLGGSTRVTTATAAVGAASSFGGRRFAGWTVARPSRAAGGVSTTRSMLVLGLLSSYSRATAVNAAEAAFGWTRSRNDRLHQHTPAMAASSVASAGAGAGAAAVGGAVPLVEGLQKVKPAVIFVLGGPGSGKGTQCERLAKECGYVHLSAGELLRQERESGSSDGRLIDEYIREGRIVPVSISLGLLRKAMEASGPFSRFLIDGFPRNSDNFQGWNDIMGDVADVRCVLFLHCPEDVLEERLLSRGKSSGRTDDNAETAKRRFRTYVETTLPVVELYERQGLVARVNGNQDVQSVFRDVLLALKPAQEKEVLEVNRLAVEAVSTGDQSAYAKLCASDMTELLGGGLAVAASDGTTPSRGKGGDPAAATPLASSRMSLPHVQMLNGGAAVASCERPRGPGLVGGDSGSDMVQETRVWEIREGQWKCVHCHASPCVGAEATPSQR